MTKYNYIIDAGHGGIIDGVYQTAGKRSPLHEGETLIYEGVNNRINAALIIDELMSRNIECTYLTPTDIDTSLSERVRRVNNINSSKKSILISIHSNAAGNGREWANASGISLHIAPNHSKTTQEFTDLLWSEIKCEFEGLTKFRGIRQNNFTMVAKTHCPAVLCEYGFHDNLKEAQLMLTDTWREKLVNSVVNTITLFETFSCK